ncbi:hypothetical protein D6D22_10816 [Aureobasidium pullulans]|uniref:Uncharacterized protein n=1 Tax=Aureobasidium pullulans TaxID=5580 RepID=A0A4S8WM02_AURPU|nr:hypothetical protein D6D22_10816 [Aureobasidium pullulans]
MEVLRSVISEAIKSRFEYASASIHPSVKVVSNSIVIPLVPVYIFHELRTRSPSGRGTGGWKVEFSTRSRSQSVTHDDQIKGRLVITMPSKVHEAFIAFSSDLAHQLFDSGFLPAGYEQKEIQQTGSTELKHGLSGLVPDAGISFFGSGNTFLVLEVAYSQKEEDAQRKAQRYILDTNGNIRFVVLVIVARKSGKKTTDLDRSHATSTFEDGVAVLSPDSDTVHVHVYKSIIRPRNVSIGEDVDTLTGQHIIDRVQVFPSCSPQDTFTITWTDINCGAWSDFRDGAHLPPEHLEPSCDINFKRLVAIANELAGKAVGSREGTPLFRPNVSRPVHTPVFKKENFVDSSSPMAHLSSGGTVPSDEERRLDPDYQPSEGSWDSS